MIWARMLAYVTGTVNQELMLRNEYLAAENRILRGQIKGRLLLSEGEKARLAEIAHRLGRMALEAIAATAKPDTILGWYRKLIANKFDGSKSRRSVGRPKVPWQISVIVYPTRRWATSSAATAFLQRQSENNLYHGGILSAHTGTFWWEWTSSRQKF